MGAQAISQISPALILRLTASFAGKFDVGCSNENRTPSRFYLEGSDEAWKRGKHENSGKWKWDSAGRSALKLIPRVAFDDTVGRRRILVFSGHLFAL